MYIPFLDPQSFIDSFVLGDLRIPSQSTMASSYLNHSGRDCHLRCDSSYDPTLAVSLTKVVQELHPRGRKEAGNTRSANKANALLPVHLLTRALHSDLLDIASHCHFLSGPGSDGSATSCKSGCCSVVGLR